MEEKILLDVGLSGNEVKVYLALLKLGSSSVTEISKKSKVERTLVYGVLEKLIEKGLVSSVVKINIKYFEPADPEKILELIKEKEKSIVSVMPELKEIYNSSESKQNVSIFKGKEGAKTILDILLKEKKEWFMFGATEKAAKSLEFYIHQFHLKRVQNKIKFNAIYSEDAVERAKEVKKLKFSEVRTIGKEFSTPTHVSIVGNKLGIILWSEEVIGILIENEEIAKSFKSYFDILWKISRKI